MRIIFAGTPEFSAQALQALLTTEHEICAVYTQPDRPAGRGRKLTPGPVKQLALDHNIPVQQPLNFKLNETKQDFFALQADLMIVVAYGLLLPAEILAAPKRGCINIHASLLPRWRGAAPIQRAILAGDTETGVCIMQMEVGLDTGPVLSRSSCAIEHHDTAQILHDRLAVLGAKTLLATLSHLPELQASAQPQDDSLSNYAKKLLKAEANIDWQQTATEINRQVYAFNPWPVSQTIWQDKVFRIWLSSVNEQSTSASPGEIIAISRDGIDVATGQGVIRLSQIQVPGKKVMAVADFLNANRLNVGEHLG